MNLDTDILSFTKSNSKWTMNLNVKHKCLILLEDNSGGNLDVNRFSDGLLRYNP